VSPTREAAAAGGPDTGRSWGWALAALPAVLFVLALFAYPMLDLAARSVSGPGGPFEHFAAVFTGAVERHVLLTTFKIALLTGVLTAVIGYPVALLIASARPAVAGALLLIVLVPFWTSILVRSYAWIVLLGRRGIVNTSLEALGLVREPLPLIFNLTGVTVSMVHILLPYMILPVLSVLVGLNREIFLAAESLGARPRQTFVRVLLPLTLPGILGGFVLVFTLALGFYITPALLGGRRDVMASMLIEEAITQRLAWGEAAALSFVLLGLTLGAFAACARILRLNRLLALEVAR
jgi:ABC-type spermidine/putrescine transport system permease subunit I